MAINNQRNQRGGKQQHHRQKAASAAAWQALAAWRRETLSIINGVASPREKRKRNQYGATAAQRISWQHNSGISSAAAYHQ